MLFHGHHVAFGRNMSSVLALSVLWYNTCEFGKTVDAWAGCTAFIHSRMRGMSYCQATLNILLVRTGPAGRWLALPGTPRRTKPNAHQSSIRNRAHFTGYLLRVFGRCFVKFIHALLIHQHCPTFRRSTKSAVVPCAVCSMVIFPIFSRGSYSFVCEGATVIVRVIAHAGVIAPLCGNFSSLESFNSFFARGSESSHRGAMTPILVPPSSVRLHAVACGIRIKIVPRSVFLAVCNQGSPLFVAGANHTYMKKNLAFKIRSQNRRWVVIPLLSA